MRNLRTIRLAAALATVTGSCLFFAGGASAGTPAFTINKVSAYGGEPSLTASPDGSLYEASLLAPQTFRSTDGGLTWTGGGQATHGGLTGSTGDDCLGTDQSGAVYLCNLTIDGPDHALLQADNYKSVNQGATWTHGAGVVQDPRDPTDKGAVCGTSCSPAGVDRDWVDAYIPSGATGTNQAEVVLMYHDFYGPSHIWVNISTDGGATFGKPVNVLANLNPGSAGGQNAVALADTACSTVPSAVKIVKSGSHAGRIYVAWIAADPSSFATGCNLSQAQAFHDLFVAWSDDNGKTWTPQLAYDAGLFHDASTPFVGFTLDNAGNPYFGFAAENPAYSPATCAAPQNPQTPDCEYDMYVVGSLDGGNTWDGGGGLLPGTAATAYKVNPTGDTGTHWFPAIAAADPGQVAVAYLKTPDIIPTDANGKQHPGGCLPVSGACTSHDQWNLYAAQASLVGSDGKLDPNATFTPVRVTGTMHEGDICNLGIACPPTANRNLADFISTAFTQDGCQHIVYANDFSTNEVDSANQTAGCFSALPTTNVPETSWAALLAVVGLVAMLGVTVARRRRTGSAT